MSDLFDCTEIPVGPEITRGKTKIISSTSRTDVVDMFTMNTLTAGNGKKFTVTVGIGEMCNEMTCRIFELFREHGIPVAYLGPNGRRSLLAWLVKMLPYEIVVRFNARGSFLKRHPGVTLFTPLPEPVIELYLKTNERRFRGVEILSDGTRELRDIELPDDDPYVTQEGGKGYLWRPDVPIEKQLPIAVIELPDAQHLPKAKSLVWRGAHVLRDAFALQHATLDDIKMECAADCIADSVTAHEWRLRYSGAEVSKEWFRTEWQDGRDDEELLQRYAWATELTRRISRRPLSAWDTRQHARR